MTNKLALVLPCYNPPKGWEEIVIDGYKDLHQQLGVDIALYVVNDGSPTDITKSVQIIANQISDFTFIDGKINRGKGAALRSGISKADAELYIYTDIDLPYSVASIKMIYLSLLEGYDVVAGIKDDKYYKQTPMLRRWISKLLRFSIKNVLGLSISDTQCGLKGFNVRGRACFLSTTIDRYLFDLEFIYLASKQGLRVVPKKVALRPGIIFRKMNPKILLQESRNFFKIILG